MKALALRRGRYLLVVTAVAATLAATLPATGTVAHGHDRPWLDTRLTAERRARALVDAMTLEEKVSVLHGTWKGGLPAIGYVPGIPRLKVPDLWMEDGPQDVHNWINPVPGATQFPTQITAGATWDESLVRRFGAALGQEMRDKGMDVALAPILDIAREPTWGRHFEAYGEDPHLNGALGSAEVKGIQSQGVIASVKHFATNAQEQNRKKIDVRIDERTLREIYLAPFEKVVKEARPGSVMCAYNKINGTHACQDKQLLTDILKKEWGFDGWVLTDWDSNEPYRDPAPIANAGLDQEMPKTWTFGPALVESVREGRVSEQRLDDMVTRIEGTMIRFGLFDRARAGNAETPATTHAHAKLSRTLTEQGSVLLKNAPARSDGRRAPVLPLAEDDSVAVIGPAAEVAPKANGMDPFSRTPYHVTVREGLAERAGATVRYEQGVIPPGAAPAVPRSALRPSATATEQGVKAEYFPTADQSGAPAVTRTEENVALDTKNRPPVPSLPDTWSGRWSGVIEAPADGTYTLTLGSSGGGMRLSVGGKPLIDRWEDVYGGKENVTVELKAGERVPFEVGYRKRFVSSQIAFGWYPGTAKDALDRAVAAAKQADVAVVVAADDGGEENDRTGLALPYRQDELIEAVARANPRTVVVLTTGGPVTMPWLKKVPAVLEAWKPGQEAGNAVARLLYGDVDPGGRLPVTFPAATSQTPAADPRRFPGTNDTVHFSEGLEVGYRAFDARGWQPLFPFGHGLSYTRFAHSDLSVRPSGDGWKVTATTTNTGSRTGSAVTQLYLAHPHSAGEPPQQLKGFTKTRLKPGQSKRVSFRIEREDLRVWDEGADRWTVPRGDYRIKVGGSSRELPLSTGLRVR